MARKATATRPVQLSVDDRTMKLSESALACRGFNHVWIRQTLPPNRVLEQLREGYAECVRVCDCGCEWLQVYDVVSFDIVINRRRYPKDGYLIEPGSGRLPKRESRKALWALQHRELVTTG